MSELVDDRVYILERYEDGSFHLDAELNLAELAHGVPGFGDRITLSVHGVGISVVEVVARYFVRHIDESSGREWTAWFVVVEPVELKEADALFEAIGKIYRTRARNRPPPQLPVTPALNVAPQAPRDEFKEWEKKHAAREKHRPIHRLNAPQVRALRFLADHPDCLTSDVVPNAGEKTMEALAKVGCVRAGGKDYRGKREWHVTAEGRAELQREETWRNWKFN